MPLNGNIRKFRYDLFLNDKQIFDSLGDNLIDLTKRKLVKIVEDVIEKKGYKNLIIDKIEIDLGKIDINNLASIPRKFESELLLYFEQRVNEPDTIEKFDPDVIKKCNSLSDVEFDDDNAKVKLFDKLLNFCIII